MISLLLFLKFIKFGILCFGGGYMTIPLLYTEFVENTPLFTPEQYGNLISIAQVTPGPVSINTATYVGFIQDNLIGAISSSLGLCVPTFILALLALNFIQKYQSNLIVQGILKGAKWAAFVMILFAVFFFANISILKKPITLPDLWDKMSDFSLPEMNILELAILILTAILFRYKISFIWFILVSGFIGWGYSFL